MDFHFVFSPCNLDTSCLLISIVWSPQGSPKTMILSIIIKNYIINRTKSMKNHGIYPLFHFVSHNLACSETKIAWARGGNLLEILLCGF